MQIHLWLICNVLHMLQGLCSSCPCCLDRSVDHDAGETGLNHLCSVLSHIGIHPLLNRQLEKVMSLGEEMKEREDKYHILQEKPTTLKDVYNTVHTIKSLRVKVLMKEIKEDCPQKIKGKHNSRSSSCRTTAWQPLVNVAWQCWPYLHGSCMAVLAIVWGEGTSLVLVHSRAGSLSHSALSHSAKWCSTLGTLPLCSHFRVHHSGSVGNTEVLGTLPLGTLPLWCGM